MNRVYALGLVVLSFLAFLAAGMPAETLVRIYAAGAGFVVLVLGLTMLVVGRDW